MVSRLAITEYTARNYYMNTVCAALLTQALCTFFSCLAGEPRTFYFGFCFGVVCLSVVFLIIGIVLLILDHFNPDPKEEEEGQEMKAA